MRNLRYRQVHLQETIAVNMEPSVCFLSYTPETMDSDKDTIIVSNTKDGEIRYLFPQPFKNGHNTSVGLCVIRSLQLKLTH